MRKATAPGSIVFIIKNKSKIMCKLTFSIIILIICYITAYTQPSIPKRDSIRIESLKKNLPGLKGTARVDCLNDIAREYTYIEYTRDRTPQNTHLADYYTELAYKEAEKIGYKYGMAFSLIEIDRHMGPSAAAENHIKQAIAIGELLHNNKILGWAWYRMAWQYMRNRPKVIGLWKKALEYFEKAGDYEGQTEAALNLGQEYVWKGDYEAAFPYCEKALIAARKKGIHNLSWRHDCIQESLLAMSQLYEEAGDYKTAMDHLIEAQKYGIKNQIAWQMENDLGQLFDKMGKHDSAFYYLKLFLDKRPDDFYAKMWLGQNYLSSKQYEAALKSFKECESMSNRMYISPELSLNLAGAYEGKGNYFIALTYAIKGLVSETGGKEKLNGYGLISRIYHRLGNNDSAYFYLHKYATIKDSLTNSQLLWRLNNNLNRYKRAAEDQKKATAMALLQKDILIKEQLLKEQALLKEQREISIQLLDKDNKLKQQQLNQEVFLKDQKEAKISLLDKDNRIKQQELKQGSLLNNFLVAGLMAFLLTGFFMFRNLLLKRKNEKLGRERIENELKFQQMESDKKHTEMQQQATELEMQALRAQMNPHFIFNCLSSINKYIIKNETEAASDYLTRFSRLIRMVLINSQKSLISLEDELDMLRLYLDMERLRFNSVFDYNITFINEIEPASVFIPPLLLQPFCENAIWHGLMHKKGQGKLDIALTIQANILNCTITDNGVGREKAAELKSKSAELQKSLGLKITNNRLALLNQKSETDSYYKMSDIIDEYGKKGGTQVDVRIHYRDFVEQMTA